MSKENHPKEALWGAQAFLLIALGCMLPFILWLGEPDLMDALIGLLSCHNG